MTIEHDDRAADPQKIVAELRRELAECRNERAAALAGQAATAEILQLINTSSSDLAPVFEAMLEKAMRLCDATFGLFYSYDGEFFRATASRGVRPALAEFFREPFRAGRGFATRQLVAGEPIVHIADITAIEPSPGIRATLELGGGRTVIWVALRREEALLGFIAIYRQQVRPFSDEQIALLQSFAAQAVIAMENARLLTETREALAQQTATAEVLQVINASPGDLAPVFEAMLERATRLCDAPCAMLWTYDGETFSVPATFGVPEAFAEYLRKPLEIQPSVFLAALRHGETFVHNLDLADTDSYREGNPLNRAVVDLGGARTGLLVPLQKDGRLLGAFRIYRHEVRRFTDKQIALLQNFAAQAVIAMENARLLTETREALEQQTATAEVLQVINASPGDLAPVFNATLEKAVNLCSASFGLLMKYDGAALHTVAHYNSPPKFAEFLRTPVHPAPGMASYRILRGEDVVTFVDVAADSSYGAESETAQSLVQLSGARSHLTAALRKEGAFLGQIVLYRQEVLPFTDKQIALVKNFAAQAVIAMENARLLTETREALEQQTATAKILQVINASPGDLTPVFDAMLDKALHLCEAAFGVLWAYHGEVMRPAASRGVPPKYVEFFNQGAHKPGASHQRLLDGERFVQVADLSATERYRSGEPLTRAVVDLGGVRTILLVPLRNDDAVLGHFGIYRQEVRPFTDKQIALLENFAAQAVIAMENARLLTETREALEQQTATAEVLQVINSSPGDLAPVFDAMLERAVRLCGASHGILRTFDGRDFPLAAASGEAFAVERLRQFGPVRPAPGSAFAAIVAGEPVVHVADIRDTEQYRTNPNARERSDLMRVRTWLAVALRREDTLLGMIALYRQEVRSFSEKEIALVQNFAAQAVIAMENARLLTETREALEQQTATAEVLQVINSAPGNLAPVFDAMLEKGLRLCDAAFGNLWTYDGEVGRLAAIRGAAPEYHTALMRAGPQKPEPGGALIRLVEGEPLIQITDITAGDSCRSGNAARRMLADRAGARTALWVPLRKDGVLLGFFTIYRTEVRPFSDKQIALLQNFAAQAVIAMENARLITETREALEQQTATAEVLRIINASPGDLGPVFDTLVETAGRLCGTDIAGLAIRDGDVYRYVAHRSLDPAWQTYLSGLAFTPGRGTITGRTLLERRVMHVADLAADPEHNVPEIVTMGGLRTFLGVPLLREKETIGVISLARQHVELFTERQVDLVRAFADQAVIAIENARLITETREALEQQTATAEVLQVINASPGDLAPVFDTMLERAMRLCGAEFGEFFVTESEQLRAVAERGVPTAFAEFRYRNPAPPKPGSITARILAGEPVIHVADVKDDELYRQGDPHRRALVELGGARTFLSVTLIKDRTVLGSINIYRQEVRPFADKEIALLQNFAAQAVIAMENARLLTETREALEQQTATAEVLQVINSSPGDLAPVFDGMLERAIRLCDAVQGALWLIEGERARVAATRGLAPEFVALLRERGGPTPPLQRVMRGERVIHYLDTKGSGLPFVEEALAADVRTLLWVALVREGAPVGAFAIARREVRPFTDKQIALVQNFAAQAVIAIENARLITETREALEQQTATAEVLQVINSSPGDLAPVFDAILEKAHSLCGAAHGALQIYDGELFRPAAMRGLPEAFAERLRQGFRAEGNPVAEALLTGGRFVHIPDLAATHATHRVLRAATELAGARTLLGVPLRKDAALLGAIFAFRREARPFSDAEIALLENFAAQAVIAIENARLLTELREALEQQRAIAEVLQVINSSPGDLAPVFQALLDKALALCGAAFGVLWTYDGEYLHAAALHEVPPVFAEFLTQGPHAVGLDNSHGRLLAGEAAVHLVDLEADAAYRSGDPIRRALVELGGGRVLLAVPLRKDEAFLGVFVIYRTETRPFTDKQIALLQSFAAQAVIAMDNARLLDEIRKRQAELRVTFDNMGDGVAMFDAEQRLAAWNLNFQRILDLPDPLLAERPRVGDFVRHLATHGEYGAVDVEAEVRRLSERAGTQWSAERTRPDGRVIEVRSNPVPGGGVVLIYSDVTERKRAEAEIRSARDTAERALQELQTAQASLLHAQKMAALGQLTAGIAHEIKNPLNFVNNFAELSGELLLELKETTATAMAALGDDERAALDEVVEMLRGNLDRIAEHGKRADGIVKSMLEHSRGVSDERRPVDLNALIEEALNLAYHGARAQDQEFNIAMERAFEPGLAPIEIVPQDLTRVFLNLFGNGFYATAKRQRDGAGPEFRPTLKVATRDLGEAVEIRVRDNGTGIAPEIRDKLFQPFVTTKPTGEGTGLGLSISWDIVTHQHGGSIAVESEPGQFTEFTLRLPRRVAEDAPPAAP
jgi:GAF domain-containing protein